MRSRYTAYALKDVDYLLATFAPERHRTGEREQIAAWASRVEEVDAIADREAEPTPPAYEPAPLGAMTRAFTPPPELLDRGNEPSPVLETQPSEEAVLPPAEEATERAMAELQSQVATLSVDLAERVVQRNLDRDTQQALVESFINEVGRS